MRVRCGSARDTGTGGLCRSFSAETGWASVNQTASGTTLFLGDAELHVAPGSTTVSAVRTYTADGVPIAERDSSTTSVDGTLLWLFPDDQGTVTSEVNTGTGVVTRRYTDPFGNLRGPSPTWSSSHGFLNASTSATTGLTQLGARAYDPVLGRFLSVDPVLAPDDPQQNNGYSYAANDPVNQSDPTGLCATSDDSNHCWTGGTPSAVGDPSESGAYSKVSPHFYLATTDSHLKTMRAGFNALEAETGLKGKMTDYQELAIWEQLCMVEDQSACSPAFIAQIAPDHEFMPDAAGQAIEAGALSGAVFFAGGAAAAFAINLGDIQVKGKTDMSTSRATREQTTFCSETPKAEATCHPGSPESRYFPRAGLRRKS